MKLTQTLAALLLTSTLTAAFASNFEDFTLAIGKVESSNNPKAINKSENALGIYQIRLNYFLDAQKFDPELVKYKHSDCFNPQVSKRVIWAYMAKYDSKSLNTGNWENLAKLHNGGCGWRIKKGQVKTNLENYWRKVSANL